MVSPLKKIMKRNKRAFLKAYAKTGSCVKAGKACRLAASNHSRWVKDDPQYALDFEQARNEYQDRLECEADRRAVEGVSTPILNKNGQQVLDSNGKPLYKYKYSDVLLMFRLKGLDPVKYADRRQVSQQLTISGSVDHYHALAPAEREQKAMTMVQASADARQLQTGAMKLLPGLPKPNVIDIPEPNVIDIPEHDITPNTKGGEPMERCVNMKERTPSLDFSDVL